MSLAHEAAEIVIEHRKEADQSEVAERGDTRYSAAQVVSEKFREIEWELSDRVIHEELNQLFQGEIIRLNNNELEPHFEDFIDRISEKTGFTAYVMLPNFSRFPTGKKIGDLEVIDTPDQRSDLMQWIERLENEGIVASRRSWAKITFESYKSRAFLEEELYDHLQVPLGILNVVFQVGTPPEDLPGVIENESGFQQFMRPNHGPSAFIAYSEDYYEPFLSDLSELATKCQNELTPLEETILSSIRLMTLHSRNYRKEHSFLTLVAALEGLLLRRGESPKGSRMAEKTVKLLHSSESSMEEKIEDYDLIKGWYKTRSNIIHGGYERVTGSEIKDIEETIRQIIRVLLDLSDDFYIIQKMDSDDNSYDGLNELFLESRLADTIDDQ
jgi:hypothetical protein